jgi:hypothetical protein
MHPTAHAQPAEDTGSGVGLADLDGDDDLDVVVLDCVTQGDGASCRLFFAEGGRFREATLDAGLGAFTSESMGVTAADFDADGDVDLYVTNRGPNWLFVNDGAGRFREVAAERGVADPLWSTGATWGDFDRDGHLDLYVCNYVHWTPGPEPEARPEAVGKALMPMRLNPNAFDPQPNRLYRARGDGTFEDIAEQAGVEDAGGRSLATTFCDLDGDGWLDLYVNNDVSANRLFLGGASDGGFVDVSMRTGTADPRGSMGLSVAEVGAMQGAGDGLPDLFLTHWVAQENALYLSTVRKEGQLEYRDRTRAFGLAERSLDAVGWGTAFADLDLDGTRRHRGREREHIGTA